MILRPVRPVSPIGPTGDEAAGRVDVVEDPIGIDEGGGDHRSDHVLDDVVADLVLADVIGVLRGDHDRLDRDGLAVP